MLIRSRQGVFAPPVTLTRPALPPMSGRRYSRRRVTAPTMGHTKACFGRDCPREATLAASGLGDRLGCGDINEAHGEQAVHLIQNGVCWPVALGQKCSRVLQLRLQETVHSCAMDAEFCE